MTDSIETTEYNRSTQNIISQNNNKFSFLTRRTLTNRTSNNNSIRNSCHMIKARIHRRKGTLTIMKCRQKTELTKKVVITSWHSRKSLLGRDLKSNRQRKIICKCKGVTKKNNGMTVRALRRWGMGEMVLKNLSRMTSKRWTLSKW